MMKIPFNKLHIAGRETAYMQDCLNRGQISGGGYYTDKVHQFLHDRFGCSKALLTTSGTAALELAALLTDLRPGDEVIMPSFTFVSTANAVLLRGARPKFVDIDPATLNIDTAAVEAHINKSTKAVIPVHYAGVACEMNKIMDLAQRYNLTVIEDAAQAVNAAYQGKYLGTIGHMGCYSFHGTKNIACGEGGALLINSNDQVLLDRAELLWEKGTNRQQFMHGQTDNYTWVDLGSSFLPADILAAFLYAQFEDMDTITRSRERIFSYYHDHLLNVEKSGLVKLPTIPAGADANYHIFYLLLNSNLQRNYAMEQLSRRGIQSTFHFIPLHSSPMGIKLGYQAGDLPVTEDVSQRLLRLPLYPSMNESEADYVVRNLLTILDEFNK